MFIYDLDGVDDQYFRFEFIDVADNFRYFDLGKKVDVVALDAEAGLPVLSYFMAALALRVDIYCHSPEIVHMWKLFVPLVNGERQTMSLLGIDFFIRNSAAIEEALFVAGPAAGGFNHNGEDQWDEEGNGRN